MSEPTTDEDMTTMMREFMAHVRTEANKRDERELIDRILAAASLALAALVIAWPADKKLPKLFHGIAGLAKAMWKRRDWWLP